MAFDPSKTGVRVKEQEYYQKNDKGVRTTGQSVSRSDIAAAYDSVAGSSLFEGDGVNCYRDRMINAICNLQDNEKWVVSTDTDGDGVYEDQNLLDAIADSFDSELDLYIQETVREAMQKFGSCSKSYVSDECLAWLAERGIQVDAIGAEDGSFSNRVYTFSLVDENGNVLQDENGNKGSIIFGDCLIPDGYAQGAEFNLSSILDQMGYDCVSKADFIGNEEEYFDVINQVEANINSGMYESADGGVEVLYGNTKDVQLAVKQLWGGSGSAPGTGGSNVTDGDAEVDAETTAAEEAAEAQEAEEAAEAQVNEEIEEYKEARLAELIEQYKEENDGKEPTGLALTKIEEQVELDAQTIYQNQ